QLQRWTEEDVIRPYTAGDGKGTRRAYSFRNLIEVAVCKHLAHLGLDHTTMRDIVKHLHRLWTDPKVPLAQPIQWAAYLRVRLRPYTAAEPGVMLKLVDGQTFTTLLDESNATDVMTGNTAIIEAAIALPIGRIIHDITTRTGDSVQ